MLSVTFGSGDVGGFCGGAANSNSEAAIGLYAAAEKGFETVNMQLNVAVARRRRGELIGGDEARVLIGSADSWMQSQAVKNPTRLTATLAPA